MEIVQGCGEKVAEMSKAFREVGMQKELVHCGLLWYDIPNVFFRS